MRNTSFNIFHLAVVALILMVSIAVLFPILRSMRRSHWQDYEQYQIRGIHQGIVTYANSNKNWFVGLDTLGNHLGSHDAPTGFVPNRYKQFGIDIEDRYAILLAGEFFTPGYIVSPYETDPSISEWPEVGPVTDRHYSYAMLQVPEAGPRHDQWRQTLSAGSIVLSDRNTGTATQTDSIRYGTPNMTWRGVVLWNDHHTSFETDDVMETHYGSKPIPNDHLFTASGDDDAYLIHTGN